MKAKHIVLIIIALVVVVGAFYGGMLVGKGSARSSRQFFGSGAGAGGVFRNNVSGSSITAGSIIAENGTTMTVSLRSGGSKIVFYSSSTPVTKSVSGSPSDLQVGDSIAVVGMAQSDGSIAAESIQLTQNTGTR